MSAKEIILRPITRAESDAVIREQHYSGKVVRNSSIHIGVFWRGRLEGAMQFGPSLDKRKIIGLVSSTAWDGFVELNRMAFSEVLPPNSESRALSIAMRLLRRHAPKLEWVVSFADATQCGDGTIYRASGFVLTGIRQSGNLARLPDGTTIHKMTLESSPDVARAELGGRSYYDVTGGRYNFDKYVREVGGSVLVGYQLRYVYFVNPAARQRLTVDPVPFSQIDAMGASMYRGQRRGGVDSDAPADQAGQGGANPTPRLQGPPDG